LKIRQAIASLMIVSLLAIGMPGPAAAGVVGAGEYLELTEHSIHAARVDAVLARAEVREQLVRFGVNPDMARERAAALTGAELALLADRLEEQPAGGALAVIGVVFVVLIILELVGVIDIFKRT
jgi:hypothetical protein